MAEWIEEPGWQGNVVPEMFKMLDRVGENIARDAKAIAPVDTGALRASIRSVREADVVHVGSDLKYSLYVEEGHRVVTVDAEGQKHWTGKVVPPRPYLQTALYAQRGVE